ncbi:hypothetical protein T265_05013 [Opisthorchis viverrini]|uniref:Uncharacterized protein n=1 Tax=Opisthorchis viverrini TaxID=6198 RepID=A0A075AFV1_OPIVI|nr:hypothetical protein T265_05013 [Opisthorchis viverrini]KER28104.1 hypothetical protein T265_05013 [Opisthorchis viverrini]
MYRDISNIVATETRGGLVQHIQLSENITNERFSWVPAAMLSEGSTRDGILPDAQALTGEVERQRSDSKHGHSAVTRFRCIAAILPEGSKEVEIMPSCPGLDGSS